MRKSIQFIVLLGLAIIITACGGNGNNANTTGSNNNGENGDSSIIAPGSLSVSVVSDGGITLAWNDLSDNETGFVLERSLTSEFTEKTEIQVDTDIETWQDTGLLANTRYYYRIKATGDPQDSEYSVIVNQITEGNGAYCLALPEPSGHVTIVTPSEAANLGTIISNASSGDTISLQDGIYEVDGNYIWISTPNITIRSESGNREAVIIDANYHGSEIITIAADDVTIADITLKRAYTHAIHVTSTDSGDTLNTLIYNVHVIDPREQGIKINPHSDKVNFTDYGTIACSSIEMTDEGRPNIHYINSNLSCYTGGIDAHQSKGWVIRDNYIEGFWCDNGLSEHAIHFWAGSRDTVVERNTIVNNARGIGFGLYSEPKGRTYDDADLCNGAEKAGHVGGVIRNNIIFSDRQELEDSAASFDNGISMAQACGTKIIHNTVFSTFEPLSSSIEWRFDDCNVELINNLVSHNLNDRGGVAALSGNITNASADLFVNAAAGDLHLNSTAAVAIDQGAAVSSTLCSSDFDGEARDSTPDVGADENN